MSIFCGSSEITKGEFSYNNPNISGYPSIRRNIICTNRGMLIIQSLKGGDGMLPNSSMWILNDDCEISGIILEHPSELFVPHLDSVDVTELENEIKLTFKGLLLLPCDLSFGVVTTIEHTDSIEYCKMDQKSFANETFVEGKIPKDIIMKAPDESQVTASIWLINCLLPNWTSTFVLKNKTASNKATEYNSLSRSERNESSWLTIVMAIFAFLFFIVLIVSIVVLIRWRKLKEEAKKYKEIVEDTVRKDPKAFEMVTMEMSPEEQWRRAEREAEKKNEERMKKRVYDTNMQHSESSEYLLSESGSTEYILGKDSDKIPQWMLEKVDEKEEEEEETRKRTPSPSISSTSTADSDSTFVRREDLCPTTSSMSNLVDAMACSSPHEKLIVDLRDSLFMLLHGLNKTKEMAIGICRRGSRQLLRSCSGWQMELSTPLMKWKTHFNHYPT
ncbi:uncharacterized protein MONOS_11303 [Monocercomonoides exilis]|uniref:uncharacterized protein n=1 Tax=Monocercomonoides exilis TaxID=2049356 RepID=UPI003559CAE1|nr:hypothetical protein MONOS_11303 [Monocercomonoides exilis]|eukprot:MONOS_11303.1-p1 / transcript=MONOS_11303.1 / gene=MONOS_11303 / organism=Monocercomonoides_exilis_PA203 / gene_product=unspecified product / transcript_product=unspecified product / location=Mono_scaffold00560:20663-21997(-) / protein_length=445 / sequence_SO=supercontig / SO=protein_coding / is_pseudo=false